MAGTLKRLRSTAPEYRSPKIAANRLKVRLGAAERTPVRTAQWLIWPRAAMGVALSDKVPERSSISERQRHGGVT